MPYLAVTAIHLRQSVLYNYAMPKKTGAGKAGSVLTGKAGSVLTLQHIKRTKKMPSCWN
ncbi:hypothetical protein ACCAA_400064 [Candidatus Accumulibacter aalborgensis]|uniref:Uncharacterized protein n=1 Tax=Candidatus Accumulibacter aalborgensis TaxID=1860102 RepID=A0A1A8XPZ3_9PROT|nr:hypothetical protein ACCAA_400064 [Candidatus Accumulibacter aalborgensis]